MPTTIAILGLGLIGGTLGLALRAAGHDVVGFDPDPAVVAAAVAHGAIARGAASAGAAAAEAGTVLVATPIFAVEEALRAIAPHVRPGTLVSDVASTKVRVLDWARAILPAHAPFVGGHPMAGSEKIGVIHARAELLRGAPYVVVAPEGAPEEAILRLEALILAMGARPVRLAAELHDTSVAAISHVPFLMACALVEACAEDSHWPIIRELAATGFRDMSRLAADNVGMHRDICSSNAEAIRPRLRDLARRLEQLADHLDDRDFLEGYFPPLKTVRDEWFRDFEARQA